MQTRRDFLKNIVGFSFLNIGLTPGNAEELASQSSAIDVNTALSGEIKTYDLKILDKSTGRDIQIRIRLPKIKSRTGLILYSPGLGSGLEGGHAWCESWQRSGYVVATISHPSTNDDIWDIKNKSFKKNIADSIAYKQYGLRVQDCKFVISFCLNNPLISSYVDSEKIGIAGHSYGALTVQSIAGQLSAGNSVKDIRVKAAIAFSPGAINLESARGVSNIKIPFFCIMGSRDNHVTFLNGPDKIKLGMTLTKRISVYENLPKGNKYLLVFNDADHMSFSGSFVDATRLSRDVIGGLEKDKIIWDKVSNITTCFWDYYFTTSKNTDHLKIEQRKYDLQLRIKKILNHNDDRLEFG